VPGTPGATSASIGSSKVRFRWREGHRDEFEGVVLVLAMLVVILLVVLTLGSTVPVGV
jgi:hypothetical protein